MGLLSVLLMEVGGYDAFWCDLLEAGDIRRLSSLSNYEIFFVDYALEGTYLIDVIGKSITFIF